MRRQNQLYIQPSKLKDAQYIYSKLNTSIEQKLKRIVLYTLNVYCENLLLFYIYSVRIATLSVL